MRTKRTSSFGIPGSQPPPARAPPPLFSATKQSATLAVVALMCRWPALAQRWKFHLQALSAKEVAARERGCEGKMKGGA